jgi:anti-sigma factor RsiW
MVDSEYPTENRLWQMAKARDGTLVRAQAGPCPDAMALSAWLDGRADQRVADQVESHLTSCPACLDAVMELRSLVAQGAQHRPAAPQAVLDHAKTLVQLPAQARSRNQRATVPAAVLAWPHWAVGAAKWAAAAMVLLAIAYGGFTGGLQTSKYLAQRPAARANENVTSVQDATAAHANETAALVKEGPFGLGQADATDQDELIAMAEAD